MANETMKGRDEREMQPKRLKLFLSIAVIVSVGLLLTSCFATFFDQPPKPVITISEGDNPYGPAPLTITFDISGSSDPDGEIVSFSLDFGDGSKPFVGTDITQPIEHTYQSPGTYFARVTLTDDKGKTAVSPGLLIAPS